MGECELCCLYSRVPRVLEGCMFLRRGCARLPSRRYAAIAATGNLQLRKNRRPPEGGVPPDPKEDFGVDLNRNYGFMFQSQG